ncbi:hypothetical protein ACFL59_04910 [Planctomycetota bacterium]
MKDRFTYVDVLMYVFPGVYGLAILMLGLHTVGVDFPAWGKGVLGSVVFLCLAFFVGTAIQATSRRVENRLKEKYWKGHFPSAHMFHRKECELLGIPETSRVQLLKQLVECGLTTSETTKLFDNDVSVESAKHAQDLSNVLRSYLAEADVQNRMRGAEAHYLYYRGVTWLCTLGALYLAVAIGCHSVAPQIFGRGLVDQSAVIAGALAVLLLICCHYVFRDRARGAALGLSRVVYRIARAHFAQGEKEQGTKLIVVR